MFVIIAMLKLLYIDCLNNEAPMVHGLTTNKFTMVIIVYKS